MAHLLETTSCIIGIALLMMNLSRSLGAVLALFCLLLALAYLKELRSAL